MLAEKRRYISVLLRWQSRTKLLGLNSFNNQNKNSTRLGAIPVLAEKRRFELPMPFGIHAFQACTLDHSDTSPTSLMPILIYFGCKIKCIYLIILKLFFYTLLTYNNIYIIMYAVINYLEDLSLWHKKKTILV